MFIHIIFPQNTIRCLSFTNSLDFHAFLKEVVLDIWSFNFLFTCFTLYLYIGLALYFLNLGSIVIVLIKLMIWIWFLLMVVPTFISKCTCILFEVSANGNHRIMAGFSMFHYFTFGREFVFTIITFIWFYMCWFTLWMDKPTFFCTEVVFSILEELANGNIYCVVFLDMKH